MTLIYSPKGRAAEYSPLALNLYTGCAHGCKYCYAPDVLHIDRKEFHAKTEVKKTFSVEALERECRKYNRTENKKVLLCFTTDPYQPDIEGSGIMDLTREVLLMLDKYFVNVTILTKGGMRAARDFDIMRRRNWWFGSSISFIDEKTSREWEPRAAAICNRIEAIKQAHEEGIRTWVSVEPVIDPKQALEVIKALRDTVDYWMIGKINHNLQLENAVDWKKFRQGVERLLESKGNYYLKSDLVEASFKGDNRV